MFINGGDNTYNGKALFRAGIMDSGSMVPATDSSSPKPQAIFDRVSSVAGCSTASDQLACLRALSQEDFQTAVTSVPGLFSYSSLDLSYLPRPDPTSDFFALSPDAAAEAGLFAKIPIIVGDQQDEGKC